MYKSAEVMYKSAEDIRKSKEVTYKSEEVTFKSVEIWWYTNIKIKEYVRYYWYAFVVLKIKVFKKALKIK